MPLSITNSDQKTKHLSFDKTLKVISPNQHYLILKHEEQILNYDKPPTQSSREEREFTSRI